MKRNTQTKDLIKQTLLMLIHEKNVNSITVIELCKKAGLNRSTFYLHYQDIKSVILDMEAEFLTQVETYINDTSVIEEVNDAVFLVLSYIKENRSFAKALVNNNVDPSFSTKLFSIPKIKILLDSALTGYEEQEREYVYTFVISGAYALITNWVNNDFKTDTKIIASLTLSLAEKART